MPTIGDSIKTYEDSLVSNATAADALNLATAARARTVSDATAATDKLKTDLHVVGPAFIQDSAGKMKVYVPTAEEPGFAVLAPSPAGTSIPDPAPAP